MKFRINLDDFAEKIFDEMEILSEGGRAHEFIIEAYGINTAAEMASGLLIPFMKSQLSEVKEDDK